MFLLIQLTGTQKRIQKINFKFHYVSINSKLKSILTGEQAALNSIMFLLILQEHPASKFLYLPLNSIMFLLIHVLVTVEISCVFALNSIMFLLIPAQAFIFHPAPLSFKFHYVSINSRPKTNCLFTPRNTFILSTSSKYIISFSLFIICFSNTSYFSHFLLLSIPCVFYTITGRQKSLYFYHIKFFISLTLPIMNPINQICNPNIQIHI